MQVLLLLLLVFLLPENIPKMIFDQRKSDLAHDFLGQILIRLRTTITTSSFSEKLPLFLASLPVLVRQSRLGTHTCCRPAHERLLFDYLSIKL